MTERARQPARTRQLLVKCKKASRIPIRTNLQQAIEAADLP